MLLNLCVPNRVTCQTCVFVMLLCNVEILANAENTHDNGLAKCQRGSKRLTLRMTNKITVSLSRVLNIRTFFKRVN